MASTLSVKNLYVENTFELGPLNFDLPQGIICGIFGENGAGKTTLIKELVSHNPMQSGTVMWEGRKEFREILAYMPDTFPFKDNLRVREIVRIMELTFKHAWDKMAFTDATERYDIDVNDRVSMLSTGMRQRLMCAIALSHNAELLVLDEPTEGIDPATRLEIIDDLSDYRYNVDATILIATHNVSELGRLIDYIIYLENGEMILKCDIESLQQEGRKVLKARGVDEEFATIDAFINLMQGTAHHD
ncbi:ABC transporter ATP-binding protein [Erysipelothrix sp. HDW6C]|uniref:ATP-binding cassette domain-containing protein n=1 Tax=Erysipelothrix sp. HDW6C TaxID=2714930 RepID=UPI0014093FDA|nr:ABC transporter ATP-binding protein [Erysipelothrix sp. HDW6C]QIK68977.1 ABC transporter ATP-binding protein [Erysipelothrix sp. HDW6C]